MKNKLFRFSLIWIFYLFFTSSFADELNINALEIHIDKGEKIIYAEGEVEISDTKQNLILLDLFYKIFLFPIEWLMKVILEALYVLTDNYGLSIIFLSILINILTLPFYYVAEHLKIQHKKKIEPLHPKIDLLKR